MEDDENEIECHDCSNPADMNLEMNGDYYCEDCANACGNCRSVGVRSVRPSASVATRV